MYTQFKSSALPYTIQTNKEDKKMYICKSYKSFGGNKIKLYFISNISSSNVLIRFVRLNLVYAIRSMV